MTNILLTQRCVRSCPYCFAQKHMSDAPPDDVLSWENLIYLADFLEASGDQQVGLLGGEPTLHPDFVPFALYLLERGFRVAVFTSGIMSKPNLDRLQASLGGLEPGRLGFVCNLNEPRFSPKGEMAQVHAFLEAFGPMVNPGFNIYRLDFDLTFLAETITRFGLKPHIRLGMANPIPGMPNKHIRPEDMPAVVNRIMEQAVLLDRLRVGLGPDCGFPLCAFSDAQLGLFHRMTGGQAHFGCGPAIDIGPDMMVWSCFPLSNHHKRSVFEFNRLEEIRDYFDQSLRTLRVEMGGLYEACDDCRYREDGLCAGGCAAHILSAFQGEAPIRLPEIYQ